MNSIVGLMPLSDDVRLERAPRVAEASKIASFGISYLDRALIGMIPSDLVLVGAKSGIGKTEIALHMAAQNAKAGRRVGFLALEAERHEIARRLKYKALAQMYFDDKNRYWNRPISYRLFRFNMLSELFEKYEAAAEEQVAEIYSNLSIYYRGKSFGVKDFKQVIESVKNSVDLLVVDHLHYFELNEHDVNREITEVMKQIRDANLFYNIPIILVAHLRKNTQTKLPELEDFFGSSDIGKIATTAVMLAPDYDNQDYARGDHGTFMRIVKSRMGNIARLVAKVNYSSRTNCYDEDFKLAKVTSGGDVGYDMDSKDYPDWALHDPGDHDVPF